MNVLQKPPQYCKVISRQLKLKKKRCYESSAGFVKQIASPGLMHETGCSGPVHWDNPEGWDEEGGGFRMGNTCTPMADSCQCMAQTTTILK